MFCSKAKKRKQLKRIGGKSEEENVEVPKFDITYKDLIAMVVCDATNLEWLDNHCKNCPGYLALEKFIRNKFAKLEIVEEM